MTIREIKDINRQISKLSLKLERLNSEMLDISPSLSDMPASGGVSDKIGKCVTEIADLEKNIADLKAKRDYELSRLSKDVDEENCIYLFLVRHYSWAKIAIQTGGINSPDNIRMKCTNYEW